MIRARFNLRCPKGHQHYSPTPEAFVGRACFYPLVRETTDTTSRGKKCNESLRLIRPKKAEREPATDEEIERSFDAYR